MGGRDGAAKTLEKIEWMAISAEERLSIRDLWLATLAKARECAMTDHDRHLLFHLERLHADDPTDPR